MKEILKSIYPYLFLFFVFVLPLDKYATAIPNIVLIALLTFFPFVVSKKDFLKLKSKKIYIFSILIIYISINSLLFQDYLSDITIIQKVISAFLLIVLYIPIENINKLKKTIIVSVFIGILISLWNLYFFYLSNEEFKFATGSIINEVLIIDRLYLGILCIISIIASLGLMDKNFNATNKWYFTNIIINVIFVLLISSRVAIILLFLLYLIKIFYTKKRKTYFFFSIGIIGVTMISFYLNNNLRERFLFTNNTEKNVNYVELVKKWEPRVVIWKCNYLITKSDFNLFKGIGFYRAQEKLTDCYSEVIKDPKKREYFIKKQFNPHNQFLDFYLSSGLIAVILFLILYSLLFFQSKYSYYKMALFISLLLFTFIESFFHRQLGGYIFALILILIMFEEKSKNLEKLSKQ
ncbi:O-antigen ligase family protein [bacterium]|nr:O-antigen ligase family protein [bacterium]MDA9803361.1 O-antigen ligase family protein [Flavobacteriaceae bacterium]MDA9907098.1 O-antigen ligase family protein [Flavobacteriaceae bacterium]MDB3865865.1 O-antigen ligase family protein [bacterium]